MGLLLSRLIGAAAREAIWNCREHGTVVVYPTITSPYLFKVVTHSGKRGRKNPVEYIDIQIQWPNPDGSLRSNKGVPTHA